LFYTSWELCCWVFLWFAEETTGGGYGRSLWAAMPKEWQTWTIPGHSKR
jgi:hypothetical protein